MISPEVDDHAGVVQAQWSRQEGPSMSVATVDDDEEDGPMAAAYGRGLADGQAGLDYHVPPARETAGVASHDATATTTKTVPRSEDETRLAETVSARARSGDLAMRRSWWLSAAR